MSSNNENYDEKFKKPELSSDQNLKSDEPPKLSYSKNGHYLSLYKRLYNILFKPPLGDHILNYYREKIDITVFFQIPFVMLYFVCICIDFSQFIVFLSFTTAIAFIILLIIIKFFGLVEIIQQLSII